MLTRLVDAARTDTHDLSSLGSIVVGGAPLYQEDLRAATDTFGPIVAQIYGQGESPMTITAMPPGSPPDLAASCGRAFPGVEVSVLDADGARLGAGETGEVAVRGDVVMTGYWADPDATARTVVDGWLHTGDVGHLDADGHLFLTDRAKDVIITGGSNVYPREVEEVLLTHPLVHEVAVVGVPDSEWGESVCAFVVAGDGADADALVDLCRSHLASFKKPRRRAVRGRAAEERRGQGPQTRAQGPFLRTTGGHRPRPRSTASFCTRHACPEPDGGMSGEPHLLAS